MPDDRSGRAMISLPPSQGLPETCDELIERQRERVFCIRQQQRCDRSVEALLARSSGYHSGLDPAERKKLFARAVAMRLAIESGEAAGDFTELVLASASSRAIWDELRLKTEKSMIRLARALPAMSFVRDVRGFGELGLAVIVGEAGDLGNYANPAKLWKRLGLAVFDGRRQGSPGDGATKEDWIRHGYNPSRRAETWVFCSDVLFRAQWRGARDDSPAHAIGPYGEAYAERKAWDLARGWTPAHADNDARRYMTKRLLRDLWRAWRDATAASEPSIGMHPAEDSPRVAA